MQYNTVSFMQIVFFVFHYYTTFERLAACIWLKSLKKRTWSYIVKGEEADWICCYILLYGILNNYVKSINIDSYWVADSEPLMSGTPEVITPTLHDTSTEMARTAQNIDTSGMLFACISTSLDVKHCRGM